MNFSVLFITISILVIFGIGLIASAFVSLLVSLFRKN